MWRFSLAISIAISLASVLASGLNEAVGASVFVSAPLLVQNEIQLRPPDISTRFRTTQRPFSRTGALVLLVLVTVGFLVKYCFELIVAGRDDNVGGMLRRRLAEGGRDPCSVSPSTGKKGLGFQPRRHSMRFACDCLL